MSHAREREETPVLHGFDRDLPYPISSSNSTRWVWGPWNEQNHLERHL